MENSNLVNLHPSNGILPDAWQVSNRLNDLAAFYSKAEIEACVTTMFSGHKSSQYDLSLHLENLINTYGLDVFCDVLNIILSEAL